MFDTEPAAPARPSRFVVLCTAPDQETATRLARAWVEGRLAACVNVIDGIISVYRWEGAVQEDREVLLVAKTDAAHLDQLIANIEADHPYDCPEAIALPIAAGAEPYLEWIGAALA